MTDKDAKEILRREYYRVVDRLGEVDPLLNPGLYKELLEIAERLHWYSENEPAITPGITVDEIIDEAKSEPEPEPETEPETEPGTEPEPEPETEPVTAAKTYTKEEVRAALAKSRKTGTNVVELLGDLGYDNFSAVPAAKYGEIMARLGET